MRSRGAPAPARSLCRRWLAAVAAACLCFDLVAGSTPEVRAGRLLLGFQEKKGNTSYRCSSSGPCVPCQYSEKNDDKYHCSKTGYRVAVKCVETKEIIKEKTKNKHQRRLSSIQQYTSVTQKQPFTTITNYKWRKLLEDSSIPDSGENSYITYMSCVPIDPEERLSVIGFEMIMVGLLLISGPVVYMRQKHTVVMPGAGSLRVPANAPRF